MSTDTYNVADVTKLSVDEPMPHVAENQTFAMPLSDLNQAAEDAPANTSVSNVSTFADDIGSLERPVVTVKPQMVNSDVTLHRTQDNDRPVEYELVESSTFRGNVSISNMSQITRWYLDF